MRKTKQFATRSGNKIFHIRQADSYQETEWNYEIYSQLPVPLEPPFADAGAAPSLPASLNGFVHYSTSNYGGKISDKYVQKTSIQALQSGKTLPYGTAVVGIEYRDQNGKRGPVLRYIIMEKVRNGGKDYPASVRNGDWEFASFTPARALITNDPVTRCLACHKSQAQSDYLFGLNEMKSYKLK